MSDLTRIYSKLIDQTNAVLYKNKEHLVSEDGIESKMTAKEILEITNPSDKKESFSIVYFGDNPTILSYKAQNKDVMKKTLDQIKIPDFSNNVGEQAMSILKHQIVNEEDVIIGTIKIIAGYEKQLNLIANKFARVYSGKEIDSEFYSSTKK